MVAVAVVEVLVVVVTDRGSDSASSTNDVPMQIV